MKKRKFLCSTKLRNYRGEDFARNKRGQVWVETVLYTLIAFVMIGLVLAVARPKIEEIQDKAIIEQSIKVVEDINSLVLSITQGGPGNKRLIELGIKKGELKIDGENDELIFEIEGSHTYSQPGQDVYNGDLIIHTEEKGKINTVTIRTNYSGSYNITYQGKDEIKTITKSPTPYKLFITNKGGDKTIIDFDAA